MAGKWHKGYTYRDAQQVVFRSLGNDRWQVVPLKTSRAVTPVYMYNTEDMKITFVSLRTNSTRHGKPILASKEEAADADRAVSRYYGG